METVPTIPGAEYTYLILHRHKKKYLNNYCFVSYERLHRHPNSSLKQQHYFQVNPLFIDGRLIEESALPPSGPALSCLQQQKGGSAVLLLPFRIGIYNTHARTHARINICTTMRYSTPSVQWWVTITFLISVMMVVPLVPSCQAFHLNGRPRNTVRQVISATTSLSVVRDLRSTQTTLPHRDDNDRRDDENDVYRQIPQKRSRIPLSHLSQPPFGTVRKGDRRYATSTTTTSMKDVEFVAETNLPTPLGMFRLRGYRLQPSDPVLEPCVIYATDRPLLSWNDDGGGGHNVPVRVHDQCITSEVFGSLRYVPVVDEEWVKNQRKKWRRVFVYKNI